METERINEYLEVREIEGKNRIVALKDFKTVDGYEVKKGDIGGIINDGVDLGGKSWICENSEVEDIVLIDSCIVNSKVDGCECQLESCDVYDCEDVTFTRDLYKVIITEVNGVVGYIGSVDE